MKLYSKIETTDHLFLCVQGYLSILGENMSYWLETMILPIFARKHIMFGMLLDYKNNFFLINVMLILGILLSLMQMHEEET